MSITVCGDCEEVYVRQDGHRCATTTGDYLAAIGSLVDGVKRLADLERQVVELKDENARLRAGQVRPGDAIHVRVAVKDGGPEVGQVDGLRRE